MSLGLATIEKGLPLVCLYLSCVVPALVAMAIQGLVRLGAALRNQAAIPTEPPVRPMVKRDEDFLVVVCPAVQKRH